MNIENSKEPYDSTVDVNFFDFVMYKRKSYKDVSESKRKV